MLARSAVTRADKAAARRSEYPLFFLEIEMTDLAATLEERGSRYGKFTGHAEVTMDIKRIVRYHLDQKSKVLDDDMMESLDMIAHKIGRIVNGDPEYADSWIDIAGYAKLVSDRLTGTGESIPVPPPGFDAPCGPAPLPPISLLDAQ